MHSVRLKPTKLVLVGTRTTYQATGDAIYIIIYISIYVYIPGITYHTCGKVCFDIITFDSVSYAIFTCVSHVSVRQQGWRFHVRGLG